MDRALAPDVTHRAIIVTAVVAAVASFALCNRAVSGPPERVPPPRRTVPDDPEPLHTLMHRHFNDVRKVHGALLRNDLRGARRAASRLATITAPGQLPGWEQYVARIRATASALAGAKGPTRARQLLAQLATECGACHEESADISRFIWGGEPTDDGSPAGRMARHEWAAESVWMGLVGPSDDRWREGLDVMAEAPLLPDAFTSDRSLHDEVERYAHLTAAMAVRARRIDDADQRAAAFAELLGACAGCHGLTREPARPRKR